MQGERQPVRHARKAVIPTFFLFLLLISLFTVVAGDYNCQPSQEVQPQSDFLFSANSELPIGKTGLTWIIRPDGRLRWYMRNPANDIVYYVDVGEIHETAPGEGYIDDPNVRVSAFPDTGLWKMQLVVKGALFGVWENEIIVYTFNVGESSLTDNIMAPIYLTWGGIPAVGWGEFSFALPGLFWITSPFWVLAILFIMLAFYVKSIKVAAGLIKEGGRRFKLAVKGGRKT